MKKFYHGSPTPNIQILEPRFDKRLGITGLFVADEPFGPMIFSLLPERFNSTVNYSTKDGKLVEGSVKTSKINQEGWLYEVDLDDNSSIVERKAGRYHLTKPVKVSKVTKVSIKDVEVQGWKIEIV